MEIVIWQNILGMNIMSETRKCPYCSEEILAEAKKCKHCGEYLDSSLRKIPSPQQTTVVTKEGCFLQTLNTGCILIAVLIGGIILAIFLTSL